MRPLSHNPQRQPNRHLDGQPVAPTPPNHNSSATKDALFSSLPGGWSGGEDPPGGRRSTRVDDKASSSRVGFRRADETQHPPCGSWQHRPHPTMGTSSNRRYRLERAACWAATQRGVCSASNLRNLIGGRRPHKIAAREAAISLGYWDSNLD